MKRFGAIYPSYRFKDHDPIIDYVDTLIGDAKIKRPHLAEISGVSATTLRNWSLRKTKRPQFATIAAVVRSLDAELVVRRKGGESYAIEDDATRKRRAVR